MHGGLSRHGSTYRRALRRRGVVALFAVAVVALMIGAGTGTAAWIRTAAGSPAVKTVAFASSAVKWIAPKAGSTAGGATVTLTGSGFSHVSKVLFGTVPGGEVHNVSAGKLTVVAPAHAPGTVDVRVVTVTGAASRTSATAIAGYTYYAPPAVTGVSPDAGPLSRSTTVTVTGTGFQKLSRVTFGGIAGRHLRVVSPVKLTVTAPEHSAGTVDIRVIGKYGTSSAGSKDRYTYTPGPAVTGITPSSGLVKGGTTVTVTGSGLSQVTKVTFGSVRGRGVKILSAAKLTVIVPAGPAGTLDVRVTGPDGTSPVTPKDQYTYLADATPPSAVTGLSVSGTTSSSVTLSWTNPSGSNYAGVVIRRAEGATPPATPTSGTAVTDLAAPASTWTDTGLSPGTAYTYALFAHDAAGGYAAASTISATTAPPPGCTPAVQHVSGTLTADTTWSPTCTSAYVIDSNLDVPAGITLTVAPGTIVKASGKLSVEGTLDVAGTADSPVIFTSVNDSTAGGTTGTGSPAAGDWPGIWVDNGSVDIEHAKISYASSAVAGGSADGSVVVQDTQISSVYTGLTDDQPFGIYISGIFGTFTAKGDSINSSADGIDVMSPDATVTGNVIVSGTGSASPAGLVIIAAGQTLSVTAPVVENNTVTVPSGRSPYAITSPALDFAQLATNSMGSSAQPGFVVAGTVASSQTLPAEPYPWLLTEVSEGGVSPVGLDVASGATLTVAPGAVIKASGPDNPNNPGSITVEGTLDAAGTADSPVIFTSVNDSTAGGATGTGSPAAGDWAGIWVDNGNVDIEHTKMSYASAAVGGSSVDGSVTVDDTQISSVRTGLTDDQYFSIYSGGVFGTFTAERDSVTSGAAGIDVTSPDATVTDNVITSGTGSLEGGLVLDAAGTLSVTAPVIKDNTVTAAAGRAAYEISSPALDFAQLATNSTGSSAQPGFVVAGTVASSQTLPAESYPWLLTGIYQSGGLSAVGLDVPSGVTLTVAPGTVVKAYGPVGNWITKITVEGTLDTAGTAASPVTFTSVNDNSVGGDTSWDGSDSNPVASDWFGISVNGGSVDFQNTSLAYASTALFFSGTSGRLSAVTISNSALAVEANTGALSLRGALNGDGYDITACNWGNGCTVDAAYVDWGTSAGPFPSGKPPLACGAVTVTPWTDAGPDVSSNLWAVQNCNGSSTPSEGLTAAQNSFNETIAGEQVDCSGGMQSACQEMQTYEACYANLEQIAWNHVSIGGVPATPPDNGDVEGVFNSWLETADIPVVSSIADVKEFGDDISDVVDLYSELTSAYNTCAA